MQLKKQMNIKACLNVFHFSLWISLSFFHVSESKRRSNKEMVIQEREEEDAMVQEPYGRKMPEVIDPYALVADPTAIDMFTEGYEFPENKPNKEIKKFLRREDDRAMKRAIRVKFFGKSRHPNTEDNWRTKRTEPDFTSIETHPDHARFENKYSHLFIE